MKGFEKGWAAFFEVLRRYLAHFAGMKAEIASAMRGVEAPHLSQTLLNFAQRCLVSTLVMSMRVIIGALSAGISTQFAVTCNLLR